VGPAQRRGKKKGGKEKDSLEVRENRGEASVRDYKCIYSEGEFPGTEQEEGGRDLVSTTRGGARHHGTLTLHARKSEKRAQFAAGHGPQGGKERDTRSRKEPRSSVQKGKCPDASS